MPRRERAHPVPILRVFLHPDSHLSARSLALPRGGAHEQEKRALEAYFAEHGIQEKLNAMLNEMVQVRPHMPYSWLATRMRRDGCGHSPSAGTVPLLPPAAKSELGKDLEKSWGFVLGLQARPGSAAAAPKAPASKPVAAAATGVLLTIEPQGSGVLLAIRPGA